MTRFFVELTAETGSECVVEAPSREAVERFMERERTHKFNAWFLDMNDYDYSWDVGEVSPTTSFDVAVNEQGEEVPR